MYPRLLTVRVLAASGCSRGLPPALAQGGLGRRRGTNSRPAGTMPGATGTAAAGTMPAALGGRGSSPPSCRGGCWTLYIITNHSGVAGQCRCLLLRGAVPDSLRSVPASRGARGGTPLNGWGGPQPAVRGARGGSGSMPAAVGGRACCPLGAAAGVQGLICVCSWAGESCCRLSGSNPPTCRGGGLLPLGPPHPSRGGARAVRPRLGPP